MKFLRRLLARLRDRWNADLAARQRAAMARLDDLKVLSACVLLEQRRQREMPGSLRDVEFKVFSQFGDDGIIQFLIRHLTPPTDPVFVEFGVEDYQESNTRFLLLNDNWRGLVMDADGANVEAIRRQPLYWRHDLTALQAFITRDNINELIAGAGFTGRIGLLSIDIDGNDYWVWEALQVVEPAIVVVEYNSLFGSTHALTIPYDPTFRRDRGHFSRQYWGCSLRALCLLATRRGYAFVGCNTAGNNAYFVRPERRGAIPIRTAENGFVRASFRDSVDRDGRLTFLSERERLELIRDMPVYDLEAQRTVPLREVHEHLCRDQGGA